MMDWPSLIRAGLRDLRLTPAEFWALTPAELGLMLGLDGAQPRMDSDRLADLIRAFPDERTEDGG